MVLFRIIPLERSKYNFYDIRTDDELNMNGSRSPLIALIILPPVILLSGENANNIILFQTLIHIYVFY